MKKILVFLFCLSLIASTCFSATIVQIGPSSDFESATSNDFDPDRVAGDGTDNDTLEGSVLTAASVPVAKLTSSTTSVVACVPVGDYVAAISTGTHWNTAFEVTFPHTLTKVILTTYAVVGSMTIDIWVDAPGATTGLAALTDADSPFDTATEPAIADASADNYFEITSFDAGEAAGAAGDWYVVNVDAAATITGATVCFEFTRTD